MINLKHEIQKRGFTVAHIKTDSIKIPEATPEIIQFVMDYGKEYGYTFEHEATYEKMCLVNDAVYIAKYQTDPDVHEECDIEDNGWTATGKQFAVPYVFKTLFSRKPIEFKDLCVTNSVTSALYLDTGTEEERELQFIGKVGLFCPMKTKGGLLLREGKDKNDNVKYDSAVGAKGYRWQEAEVVKTLGFEDDIDVTYFQKQVNDALDAIGKYGDAEWFISNEAA